MKHKAMDDRVVKWRKTWLEILSGKQKMLLRGAKASEWLFDEAGSWKLRYEAEENGSLPQNEARS